MSASFGVRAIDEPIPCTLEASSSLSLPGLLVKIADSGATVQQTAAVTDSPVGVATDSTEDPNAAGTYLEGVPCAVVSSGVVAIPAIAATYRKFDAIYVSQTAEADGHCKNDSSNSAVRVGTYVGEDNYVVAADGEHIEVLLLPL